MRKNLTTKSVLFRIILGVFIIPLSIQALFAVELPIYTTNASEMFKNNMLRASSYRYDDVIIDDLVMYEGRSSNSTNSSPCGYDTPIPKKAGDSTNVLIANGSLWAANFSINSILLNVRLSYDAQTEMLSFRKTLGTGMTYVVAQNNSSITFYLNRKAFLIINNIQNCGVNACATLRFLESKTTISLANCSDALYSASAQSNQSKRLLSNEQHRTAIASDGVEGLNATNFKKANNIVSVHQVAPNPTNNTTTISYVLTADAPVRVSIYNVIGQQIAVLVNVNQNKGEQNIEWKTAELLRGGIYFYEIIANNERMIGKIIKQ